MSTVSPARKAAFSILKTMEKYGHSDTLLRSRSVEVLSEPNRKLTTALVLGVLRWQIELDRQVRALLKHPNAKLDAEVLIALRIGAFQLVHMNRIPARAAIDESVELTKGAGHRFASGMVNAVLRKLANLREERTVAEGPDECNGGYPTWMVKRWTEAYGEKAACTICRYGQEQPQLFARLSSADVERELAKEGIELGPGELLRAARRVVSGDVTKTPLFRDGRVRIQDEGSQLIAELVPRGQKILDCCAAPGGKTLILGERNPEAEIVACDGSHQRLGYLRSRLRVIGERVECRLADVTHLKEESVFDVVLADVPCSGTGTLGRNPEIRHRLRAEDLALQAERQRAILRAALRAVRPGGFVLYSTCSLEPEENEQVIEGVIGEQRGAELVSLQDRIEELRAEGVLTDSGAERLARCVLPQGSLRLLPGEFETDGFFAALIQKSALIGYSGGSLRSS
ncbi:MAG TPA: transcription antitermination factor NusB [Terracidiphilus sp.]|nr:transcription antitermination factor NusB [Terracidiphilus sp.]